MTPVPVWRPHPPYGFLLSCSPGPACTALFLAYSIVSSLYLYSALPPTRLHSCRQATMTAGTAVCRSVRTTLSRTIRLMAWGRPCPSLPHCRLSAQLRCCTDANHAAQCSGITREHGQASSGSYRCWARMGRVQILGGFQGRKATITQRHSRRLMQLAERLNRLSLLMLFLILFWLVPLVAPAAP